MGDSPFLSSEFPPTFLTIPSGEGIVVDSHESAGAHAFESGEHRSRRNGKRQEQKSQRTSGASVREGTRVVVEMTRVRTIIMLATMAFIHARHGLEREIHTVRLTRFQGMIKE